MFLYTVIFDKRVTIDFLIFQNHLINLWIQYGFYNHVLVIIELDNVHGHYRGIKNVKDRVDHVNLNVIFLINLDLTQWITNLIYFCNP